MKKLIIIIAIIAMAIITVTEAFENEAKKQGRYLNRQVGIEMVKPEYLVPQENAKELTCYQFAAKFAPWLKETVRQTDPTGVYMATGSTFRHGKIIILMVEMKMVRPINKQNAALYATSIYYAWLWAMYYSSELTPPQRLLLRDSIQIIGKIHMEEMTKFLRRLENK